MQYALSYTPDRFTGTDGTTVHINRKDPEAVKKLMVPLPKAEEAVLAGRLAAHARVCNLLNEEKNIFVSFVVREKNSGKWTPQQVIYLRSLFYTTEMLMVGKVQVIQRDDGGKKVVIKEGKPAIKSCTEQQRVKIKTLVTEYIKAGPDLTNESWVAALDEMEDLSLPGYRYASLSSQKVDARDQLVLVEFHLDTLTFDPISDPIDVG